MQSLKINMSGLVKIFAVFSCLCLAMTNWILMKKRIKVIWIPLVGTSIVHVCAKRFILLLTSMKNQVVAISFESLVLVFQWGKFLLKYKLIKASISICLNGLNSETHEISNDWSKRWKFLFVHQRRLLCKRDFTNKNKTQKHNQIRLQFNIFYRIIINIVGI